MKSSGSGTCTEVSFYIVPNKVFKCQWALSKIQIILETEDTSSVLQATAKFKVADLGVYSESGTPLELK